MGFLVFPTYPNYDSYYSLLWGREVLDLQAPFFEGFRVPTEHPLAIAAGALLSLLGEGGDRVWVAMTLASFLWLVWGIYRLGQVAFTPLVGAIAALLLLTRFDFAFLAARGYVDVPYMALVVWAAVLEAVRPRRGWPVFALLAAAGLLRPEAWILAGLYFLWMSRGATWGERARYAALAAIAPLAWAAVDFAVTGDPLFSLHYTSSSAEDLGRQRTLGEIPSALPSFFASLVKLPVLLGALAGLGFALLAAPRRAVMPLVLLLERHRDVRADRDRRPVGDRALPDRRRAGAARVRRRRARRLHDAAAGPAADGVGDRGRRCWCWLGVVFTATRVDVTRLTNELQFRGDAHTSLVHVLQRAGGEGGAALRPADGAEPQARPRLALDPRPAARQGAGARRPRRAEAAPICSAASRSTSRRASRSSATRSRTRSTRRRSRSRRPAGAAIATSDYVAAYARC